MNKLFNIEEFLSLNGYINNIRLNRRRSTDNSKGSQEFFTPYSIVKRMCDKIPNEDILKENNGKKFDVVLMNPPYQSGLGESFLNKVLDISDKIISIQPLAWLITKKQSKRLTEKIDNYDTNIEVLNGREIFDAGISGDIGIHYINTTKSGKINIWGQEFDKCSDIKPWSNDKYLIEFKENLGEVDDSIWDHVKCTNYYDHGYEKHPNDNWWCIKIPRIRGHVASNTSKKEVKDFYTIISNDNNFINNNKGQFKDLKEKPNKQGKFEFMYFAFNTENELNNFINYIKCDFVRTCLRLVKKGTNMHRGEMRYIPWFDFSDEHFSKSPREIDNWLFKKYNISDEIRKHIEEILPDYYGIRK